MSDINIDLFPLDQIAATAFWLALIVGIYLLARRFQAKVNGHPLANTVLLTALPVMVLLAVDKQAMLQYEPAGALLLWLLGPATVGIAVPLYANFHHVRRSLKPMVLALVAGSATAVISAICIGWVLGAEPETIRSLAPKSVTTPIAMGIADKIGGLASLTAAFVIVTGIIGAVSGAMLFNALGVKDERARGFAMGTAAHGIGTARAFQEHEVAGTFSGVAMALNGIATAILLPLIWLILS